MRVVRHNEIEATRANWGPLVWASFNAESADRSAHAIVIVTVLSTVLLLAWSVGDFEHFPEHAMRFTYFRIAAVVSFGALGFHYNVAGNRHAVNILASQIRLQAEKEQSEALLHQITNMRQERLTWLESLAHFLRHELSNQIVAVSTSIDLAKSDGPPFATQTYLERAEPRANAWAGLVGDRGDEPRGSVGR